MKKTLAVVLALAMVLVMSISVFAAEKPADAADTAAWTAYYTEIFADVDADPIDLAATIVADVRNGAVEQEVAVVALEAAVVAVGSERAAATFKAVKDFLGISDAPVLPDILPEDEEVGCLAGFDGIIDSIFNAIGDFVGSLFAGNETSDYCFKTTTEEGPPMGDNSLVAIGAVALVAGAALVLTRKKDKDAD